MNNNEFRDLVDQSKFADWNVSLQYEWQGETQASCIESNQSIVFDDLLRDTYIDFSVEAYIVRTIEKTDYDSPTEVHDNEDVTITVDYVCYMNHIVELEQNQYDELYELIKSEIEINK